MIYFQFERVCVSRRTSDKRWRRHELHDDANIMPSTRMQIIFYFWLWLFFTFHFRPTLLTRWHRLYGKRCCTIYYNANNTQTFSSVTLSFSVRMLLVAFRMHWFPFRLNITTCDASCIIFQTARARRSSIRYIQHIEYSIKVYNICVCVCVAWLWGSKSSDVVMPFMHSQRMAWLMNGVTGNWCKCHNNRYYVLGPNNNK